MGTVGATGPLAPARPACPPHAGRVRIEPVPRRIPVSVHPDYFPYTLTHLGVLELALGLAPDISLPSPAGLVRLLHEIDVLLRASPGRSLDWYAHELLIARARTVFETATEPLRITNA